MNKMVDSFWISHTNYFTKEASLYTKRKIEFKATRWKFKKTVEFSV